MPEHKIGTQEEFDAAREELLAEEKELTRRGDELARKRRELPWVPVEKDYSFETEAGTKTLAELFDGRSQLLIYHFMFGPSYAAGCPVNSSIADSVDGVLPHLQARDVTFLLVSQAPVEKLLAYRRRMGWRLPWVSSSPGDFNFDLGFSQTEDQSREALEQNTASAGGLDHTLPPIVEQTLARAGPMPLATSRRAPGSAPLSATATGCTTR